MEYVAHVAMVLSITTHMPLLWMASMASCHCLTVPKCLSRRVKSMG